MHEVALQDLKAQEVAQQIIELGKSGKSVSDEEINSLLEKAKQDIASQRLFNKMTKKSMPPHFFWTQKKGWTIPSNKKFLTY